MRPSYEYAAWLQQTRGKATPEQIETVAQAYEIAYAAEQQQEQAEAAQQQPSAETTPAGLAGGVARGAGPIAIGAALGAAAGAPLAGVGAIPGAAAGATLATAAPLFDPVIQMANRAFGTKFATPSEAMTRLFDALGVASPDTEAERLIQSTAGGLSAAGGGLAAGRMLAQSASPVAQRVGAVMSEAPLAQSAAGAGAGLAGQVATESGAGTVGQMAASLAGGIGGAGAALAPAGARAAYKAATKPAVIPAVDDVAAQRTAGASVGAAGSDLERMRAVEAQQAGLRLTEGEVKRDPALLAWEREKAMTPEMQQQFQERMHANNAQALQTLEKWLDSTEGTAATPAETGDRIVKSLMSGYEAEKSKTSALYNAFRQSKESKLPVDATGLADYLNSQNQGISGITGATDSAMQSAKRLGILSTDENGRFVANPTTTGQLEDFRKAVVAINPVDPNGKRLVSEMKSVVDNAIDTQTADTAAPMMRAMRAQRAKQAQKYENRAIVARLVQSKGGKYRDDPNVPTELVWQRTILNSQPSDIRHMLRVFKTIGGDEADSALAEIRAAGVKYLRGMAEGVEGQDGMPIVSARKLRDALDTLDGKAAGRQGAGKLELLYGKAQAEEMRNLSKVLDYIQTLPPGTSVNSSGTARTVMALLAETGAWGMTVGAPLPVIQGLKALKNRVQDAKIKARIQRSLNYQKQILEGQQGNQ